MSLGSFLIFLVLAFVAAAALTGRVREVLAGIAALDVPNERSLHDKPVPRGGGIAVLAVVMTGLAFALAQRAGGFFQADALLLPALAILFFVSWGDDRRGMGIGFRLLAHFTAAILVQFALPADTLLLDGLAPLWLERAVIVLAWVWFMNLYNFMDGIDGLTSVQTMWLAASVGAFLYGVHAIDSTSASLTALLIGACGGFLVYNWHPARIFLGDAGSVPLGFLCGFLLVKLVYAGFWLPALLLPLYYLADSGVTIFKRLVRRENLFKAHRAHYYQRAALALGRHDRVVVWVLLGNLALGIAALVSLTRPVLGLALGVGIVFSLLLAMHKSAVAKSV